MRIEPEIDGIDIVLPGSFNPAIPTPAWFALHDILPKSTAEKADLKAAHDHPTAFSTDWIRIQITPNRFQAATRLAPNVRARDLVVRVFKEHPSQTPIRAIGINREVHSRELGATARDRMGRRRAPVEPWGQIVEKFDPDGDRNGMASLTMRLSRPGGSPPGGHVDVELEPSDCIGDKRLGIHVQVNDHYEIDDAASDGREETIEFLENEFDRSVHRADEIVDHVISLATDRDGDSFRSPSSQSPATRHSEVRTGDSGIETGIIRSRADDSVEQAPGRCRIETMSLFGNAETESFRQAASSAPDSEDKPPLVSLAQWMVPEPRIPTLHPLQEWEGRVVEIENDNMVALLVDLTAGNSHESEEVVMPLAEISEHDASGIVVGSIFRWVIGYERSVKGTRRRVSRIVFRDLPRLTPSDFQKGRDWAHSVLSAFKQRSE